MKDEIQRIRRKRHLLSFLFYSMTALIIAAAGYAAVHLLFRLAGIDSVFLKYMAGVFLSLLVGGGLIGAISHRQGHFHQPFYDELYEALDRIARGEFDIAIHNRAADNHKSFQDLARKVENMAAQLQTMDSMRKDFVSNVSHEIQSPLTAMKGFLAILKSEDMTNEERNSYLDIINMEADRLSGLSNHLLKLSALDAGSTELKQEEYRLDQQLRECILSLEPLWQKKEIIFNLNLVEQNIRADKELMAQVWQNLLTNAIKFSKQGESIDVDIIWQNSHPGVTVSDHGTGMTKEQQQHIFERFYVADRARKRDGGGNGLGLAIVKKIVHMHDGEIIVLSSPGEGSSFSVILRQV